MNNFENEIKIINFNIDEELILIKLKNNFKIIDVDSNENLLLIKLEGNYEIKILKKIKTHNFCYDNFLNKIIINEWVFNSNELDRVIGWIQCDNELKKEKNKDNLKKWFDLIDSYALNYYTRGIDWFDYETKPLNQIEIIKNVIDLIDFDKFNLELYNYLVEDSAGFTLNEKLNNHNFIKIEFKEDQDEGNYYVIRFYNLKMHDFFHVDDIYEFINYIHSNEYNFDNIYELFKDKEN